MSSRSSIALTGSEAGPQAHPRTIGWPGTVSLAIGGCNQSLFLIGALIAGQGSIPGQGSAAIPLLIVGLILSWAATPGWTELILLYPNRVGGIASCCAEAFRPISPVLANLTGVCYWWGWVPTCGITAILSATAIHQWYVPHVPVPLLACGLVLGFTLVNLCGVKWVTRFVIPFATMSASLAFLSGIIPIVTGHVNWHQACNFDLSVPFSGLFGKITSAMAGLYLVGFAAPAFEAAACHVGETVDPERNVPRAMFISAGIATLYFVILPVVWLGCLGAGPLTGDLQNALGPTFAPVFGSAAKAAAIWFMMFNMFHGTVQPLAGASRTLMQLAEDGLLPHCLAKRTRTDAPSVATWLTAGMSIVLLLVGDPVWMIAAANLCYLIGICLPNVAVWLLRKDAPHIRRPYRAPRFTIELGVAAAFVWGISAILGFEQFGLPTVIFGLVMAYSGSLLYAWRRWTDRQRGGRKGVARSIHTKLTGAMLMVLVLDGIGYLLAIRNVGAGHVALIAALQDIFVAVALLTITVGLVLPGAISHAAEEIANGADRLATGPLASFTTAIEALGQGDIERAHAQIEIEPIVIRSADEMGAMASSFNTMQASIVRAGVALDHAREGLSGARTALTESNERFELAIRGSNDGVWDWDITRNIVYFSPRWKAMIGYEDGELPNEFATWQEALHPDDRSAVEEGLREYLAGETETYESEFRLRHRDGTYRWILSRAVALFDPYGKPHRMSGSITDISDRVRHHGDLIEAKEAAEAASEAKTLFMANMSHELRTPMNAIIGFSDVLVAEKFGGLNEKQAKFVKTILASGHHLLALINDVLDLAKVESGHMVLELSTFNSAEVLKSSIDVVRALADKKSITIERITTPADIEADHGKFQQVVYNLLSNAIKFSPDGSTVIVRCEDALDQGREVLIVSVIDNGVGIRQEDQERIFNQFEQVDSSYSRTQKGTGLGLTLSRKLARMHGGELTAMSEGAGTGSTFSFIIPKVHAIVDEADMSQSSDLAKAA